jgi:transcriptional regulator with XRE-family HTH domain
MNPLGHLLRNRRDVLRGRGESIRVIAERAGLPQSTVYEHLKQAGPVKGMPRRETLEKLARGFQVPVGDLIEAAKESVGPLRGDPLQLLIRTAQLETGRSARQAVRKAKQEGHRIAESTVSAIINGEHANITEPTARALAAGYDLDFTAVWLAAEQSNARTHYRLPAHIEEQLTPERWAKILKIVEGILTVE